MEIDIKGLDQLIKSAESTLQVLNAPLSSHPSPNPTPLPPPASSVFNNMVASPTTATPQRPVLPSLPSLLPPILSPQHRPQNTEKLNSISSFDEYHKRHSEPNAPTLPHLNTVPTQPTPSQPDQHYPPASAYPQYLNGTTAPNMAGNAGMKAYSGPAIYPSYAMMPPPFPFIPPFHFPPQNAPPPQYPNAPTQPQPPLYPPAMQQQSPRSFPAPSPIFPQMMPVFPFPHPPFPQHPQQYPSQNQMSQMMNMQYPQPPLPAYPPYNERNMNGRRPSVQQQQTTAIDITTTRSQQEPSTVNNTVTAKQIDPPRINTDKPGSRNAKSEQQSENQTSNSKVDKPSGIEQIVGNVSSVKQLKRDFEDQRESSFFGSEDADGDEDIEVNVVDEEKLLLGSSKGRSGGGRGRGKASSSGGISRGKKRKDMDDDSGLKKQVKPRGKPGRKPKFPPISSTTTDAPVTYCRVCSVPHETHDFSKFCICCDGCNDWFHGSCVGIQESEITSETETWYCEICKKGREELSVDVIAERNFMLCSECGEKTTILKDDGEDEAGIEKFYCSEKCEMESSRGLLERISKEFKIGGRNEDIVSSPSIDIISTSSPIQQELDESPLTTELVAKIRKCKKLQQLCAKSIRLLINRGERTKKLVEKCNQRNLEYLESKKDDDGVVKENGDSEEPSAMIDGVGAESAVLFICRFNSKLINRWTMETDAECERVLRYLRYSEVDEEMVNIDNAGDVDSMEVDGEDVCNVEYGKCHKHERWEQLQMDAIDCEIRQQVDLLHKFKEEENNLKLIFLRQRRKESNNPG